MPHIKLLYITIIYKLSHFVIKLKICSNLFGNSCKYFYLVLAGNESLNSKQRKSKLQEGTLRTTVPASLVLTHPHLVVGVSDRWGLVSRCVIIYTSQRHNFPYLECIYHRKHHVQFD